MTAPGFECGAVITGGITKAASRLAATACTKSLGSGPAHIKVDGKEICLHWNSSEMNSWHLELAKLYILAT